MIVLLNLLTIGHALVDRGSRLQYKSRIRILHNLTSLLVAGSQ